MRRALGVKMLDSREYTFYFKCPDVLYETYRSFQNHIFSTSLHFNPFKHDIRMLRSVEIGVGKCGLIE